ncbi:hypothetical protein VP1G_09841 [Cytospora mali]|uniref:AB hydrolase-1 domain-containing protein n=1 Tax=Cytospora mali TaxID=578113 RepID=A0A194VFT9_CYTMA|nr:hypothetical protein VP1G_09841 [Valsa mali var. pyri (nom. inval.)]
MTSNTKPTVLIVHGGWHVPESYEKLTAILESAGYELCRKSDSGRTYWVLAHSYGGQVASNALYGLGVEARSAKGLKGGVSHLIYMTGYAGPEGVAMMDKVKEFGNMDLVPLAFDFADDDTCVSRDPKNLIVGPGDEAEVEAYLKTFVRWNGKCMYQPTEHAAWRKIPTAYIYTKADMTVPIHYQRQFVEDIEKAGRKVQTFEVETGHCPNFSAPQAVVDAVNKVVLG